MAGAHDDCVVEGGTVGGNNECRGAVCAAEASVVIVVNYFVALSVQLMHIDSGIAQLRSNPVVWSVLTL